MKPDLVEFTQECPIGELSGTIQDITAKPNHHDSRHCKVLILKHKYNRL
jgi:hypothetical protein